MTGKTLPKTYHPNETEPRIYQSWLNDGYFAPKTNHLTNQPTNQPTFTVTLPPPNITGELHVGHWLVG
jgi:valyl-tRNA synthetase